MTITLDGYSTIDNPVAHAEKGSKFLDGQEVFKFSAKAVTLNEVLKVANAPELIDFLSLDVEGAEIEVLGGINFSEFRFKLMLIETNEFEIVSQFLVPENYIFVKNLSSHDYLFAYNENPK